jgi:hypothetical protein
MQTSFMHPPFGFALFYLRSVAPFREYLDKISGKPTAPVTTGQIYWGAVPFVIIQLIMVSILIFFPELVTSGVTKSSVDATKIEIQIPTIEPGQEQGETAPPDFGVGKPEAGKQPPAKQDSGAKEGGELEDLFKQK